MFILALRDAFFQVLGYPQCKHLSCALIQLDVELFFLTSWQRIFFAFYGNLTFIIFFTLVHLSIPNVC